MATFYEEAAADALELVVEFGREVTLLQISAGPTDPLQPWLGATDPRSAPAATKTVSAVFVDPSSLRVLGSEATRPEWVSRATKIAIIATSEDLVKYTELVDTDGERFRINGVSMLKPGPLNLLAYVGCVR